jgi:Na+-transporting methylmalonyl-CoA/oxaloacetate decarboxylase gamma subunit
MKFLWLVIKVFSVVFVVFVLLVMAVVLWSNHESKNVLQTTKDSAPSPATAMPAKAADTSAVLARVLTDELHKQGTDVTVAGFDDVLVFDCSKALNPRPTCYALYKNFPRNEKERNSLSQFGIKKLKFRTDAGLFSGFAWTNPPE